MKTKLIHLTLTFFLISTAGFAGKESKGGSDLKDRFRRIGAFLVSHLENEQVRLAARLKDFENFKKTVPEVPIKIVEKFPAEFGEIAKELLVGMTVDDASSPVGKTILLHHDRFKSALEQFDQGKTTTITIVGDVKLTKEITEENAAKHLIQKSFLSFCFHEYLLASKEDDTHTKLSSLLSATRENLERWSKEESLENKIITAHLPVFNGPLVMRTKDEGQDDRKALKLFLEEYNATGKVIQEQAIKKLQEQISKKAKILKTSLVPSLPEKSTISFYNWLRFNGGDSSEQIPLAVSYHSSPSVKFYLETDKKIKYVSDSFGLTPIEGEGSSYREYHDQGALLFDKVSGLEAYQKALLSFQKDLPAKEKEYEELASALFGDRFVSLLREPETISARRTNKQRTSYRDQTYIQYVFEGLDVVEVFYRSKPYAIILE